MNNLVIPPSANWYETSILACAPDNTLMYGSRNDIVVIYDSPDDQPSDVKIIHRAHSQKIVSTNINKNWGQPHKLLVTVADDNIVKLWDIETRKKKLGHNAHVGHGKVVGATFAGDDRIISVSEEGIIIVWNVTLNQNNVLKDVFGSKVTITCISTCPHANWLTAFGLKNGLIIVTDLRKQGKVLYKLRGHDKSVLSLAWCPAPVNIFPKDPYNYVGLKSESSTVTEGSPEQNEGSSVPEGSPEQNEGSSIPEGSPKQNECSSVLEGSPEQDEGSSVPEGSPEQNEGSSVPEGSPEKNESSSATEGSPETKDTSLESSGNEIPETKPEVKPEVSVKWENEDAGSSSVAEDKKFNKNNIWSNLKHADDDELDTSQEENSNPVGEESVISDFLKDCQNLRGLIMGHVKPEIADERRDVKNDRIIIKAKRTTDVQQKNSEEKPESYVSIKNEPERDDASEESVGIAKKNTEEKMPKEEVNVDNQEATLPSKKINAEIKPKKDEVDTDGQKASLAAVEDPEEGKPKEDVNIYGQEAILPAEEDAIEGNSKDTDSQYTILAAKEDTEERKPNETDVEKPSVGSVKETSFKNGESSVADTNNVGVEDEKKTGGKAEDNRNLSYEEAKREIPVNVPVGEEPRREFLLASSGKEGNIYIWRAGTDGRMQTLLSVPNKPGYRRSGKSSSDKAWIVLCWVSPAVLLSSSKSAELVKWSLPKPKDKSKQYSLVHFHHNSMLFSIAAPVTFLNEYNWKDDRKSNVWTTGQDRLLLNTGLTSERRTLACYPTLGNAECFALSPVDPNRLAIGTAEGVIKVWDLSRPNIKSVVMTNFFQKIQSKVVTLAWHPTNELILAYGTVEGRIGLMDTGNKSKTPTVMTNFFKTQIHKVEWAPVNGNRDGFGLFAVAEGKLVLYNLKKSERAPTEVDKPEDTFVYTFAWKPDYTMLLVGTRTGPIILYSPELKILSTHYFPHRLNDIFWHPDAAQSDSAISERCYWFAAISNSKEVVVCDFRRDVDDGEKIVKKYERSEETINFVSWSPYTADELVIASDEGTAQVWNVGSNSVISTHTSPNFEGVVSAIWSPIDSDCIISAVKDHTIRVWRISDHPPREDKEIKELRKKTLKEIAKEQTDLLPKAEKVREEAPKAKMLKTHLLPSFFYQKDVPQVIDDLRKLFLWKEGSYGGETGGGDNASDILKAFGSKDDMLDIIEQNEAIHLEKGKFSLSNTLSLFKGDISDKIKRAIDEKRVNPWIIMMAPMVSPKLWQSACEVYAHQLTETADSDPVEMATFYLACHKIEEAIDVLCQGAMYREALALAKCRLPEDSPTVTKIIEKWAKYSVTVGNFETAAQCYIYSKKYEDAASVLFRRYDEATLKFAAELAEKSGNEELHKAVLFRYNTYKNQNGAEEKELPSKLDAVLTEHLENGRKVEESVVEESDKQRGGCKNENEEIASEVQNEGRDFLENGEGKERTAEKNPSNEEENLQMADESAETATPLMDAIMKFTK